MLASRARQMLCCGFLFCSATYAAEEEMPDMEFLEYLGMWEESDEDWLVLEEDVLAENRQDDRRSDPVPQGKESAETEDES